MEVILMGANNPSGAAFLKLDAAYNIETWGRRPSLSKNVPHTFCDLSRLPPPQDLSLNGVIVSFAPIWFLAPFLEQLAARQPDAFSNLVGVVACSSSSFMTKRFAFSDHDRQLANRLQKAHATLKDTCRRFGVKLQILAPTLVYGRIDCFEDKNISQIKKLMRSFPCIVLPRSSGLRQPIHAAQLAGVAHIQASKMLLGQWTDREATILTLGGNETLTYERMIAKIKDSLDVQDEGRMCKILKIPDKLFYLLACPLILYDLRLFESVLRVSSNLAGFTKAYEIDGSDPIGFPFQPLSITD